MSARNSPSGSSRASPRTPARGSSAGAAKVVSPKRKPRGSTVFKDGQARYLQIARELKRTIADGTYAVGARLPTELELCEQFGISRFTARAAVRVLSSAGLVTRR